MRSEWMIFPVVQMEYDRENINWGWKIDWGWVFFPFLSLIDRLQSSKKVAGSNREITVSKACLIFPLFIVLYAMMMLSPIFPFALKIWLHSWSIRHGTMSSLELIMLMVVMLKIVCLRYFLRYFTFIPHYLPVGSKDDIS